MMLFVVQAMQLVNEAFDVRRDLFQACMSMVTLGMDGYDNLDTTWAGRAL